MTHLRPCKKAVAGKGTEPRSGAIAPAIQLDRATVAPPHSSHLSTADTQDLFPAPSLTLGYSRHLPHASVFQLE